MLPNEVDCGYQAYISVGSNVGHRIHYLRHAVHELSNLAIVPITCSGIYETRPIGYTNQSDFLNMVVALQTRLNPRELLVRLLRIELDYGRVRDLRFGPRTLDLDILLYGDKYVCFRDLQVPHPRMWERAFVMVPLADLAPRRKALGGRAIRECADGLVEGGDVRYVGRFW